MVFVIKALGYKKKYNCTILIQSVCHFDTTKIKRNTAPYYNVEGCDKMFGVRSVYPNYLFRNLVNPYSLLKLSTGLATAAFIAWKLTVTNAISITMIAAIANNHQLCVMR